MSEILSEYLRLWYILPKYIFSDLKLSETGQRECWTYAVDTNWAFLSELYLNQFPVRANRQCRLHDVRILKGTLMKNKGQVQNAFIEGTFTLILCGTSYLDIESYG